MNIRIEFDTDNAAFQDYPHGDGNFDEEVKRILKQVEDYLLYNRNTDKLIDSNGNMVGKVFRSTTNRRTR